VTAPACAVGIAFKNQPLNLHRWNENRAFIRDHFNLHFFHCWHLGLAQRTRPDDEPPASPMARHPLLSAVVAGVLSVATKPHAKNPADAQSSSYPQSVGSRTGGNGSYAACRIMPH